MGDTQCPLTVKCARGSPDSFVGEIFRANLLFTNQVSFELERLTFTVEMTTPSNRIILLHRSTLPKLPSKGSRTIPIEHKFTEKGNYGLRTSVLYSDFNASEQKRFIPNPVTLEVPRILEETQRRVHVLPPIEEGAVLSGDKVTRRSQRMLFSISLQCKAPSMKLVGVRLIPRDPSLVVVSAPVLGRSMVSAAQGDPPVASPQGYEMCSHSDTMRFQFELEERPGISAGVPLSTPTNSVPPAGTVFYSSSSASTSNAPPGNYDIGFIEWTWTRGENDCISGIDLSSLVRFTRISVSPSLTMNVTSIQPNSPYVGDVVTLNLQIANTGDTASISLAVHVARLLPHFLYTGPTLIPLGVLKCNTILETTVSLVAHCPGMQSVAGAFELRDTAKPEMTLWPLFPGGGYEAAQVGRTLVATEAAIAPPPEPWPPRLCDIFILPRCVATLLEEEQ